MQDTSSISETLSEAIQPYIEDFNCGWVGTGNGVWTYENPTKSYSDIYTVLGGHKYFLSLGSTVGTRFRVMFSTVDVSNVSSGTVNGIAVNTSNYNNPSPNQNISYTPANDGYIIVQKDNVGTTGIKTYLHDTIVTSSILCLFLGSVKENFDTSKALAIVDVLKPCLHSSFLVKAVKKVEGYTIKKTDISSLSVTPPNKTSYRTGETIDYTGVVVTATYEDGRVVDVTSKAVFSPENGTTATLALSSVFVSFKGLFTHFNLTVEGTVLSSLSVTSPTKKTYLKGDALDYTGCTVTAIYGDGTTKDVTSEAIFSPANGSTATLNDVDSNNILQVSVSYMEGLDTVNNSFSLTITQLNSLTVKNQTKTHYIGEPLDYNGLIVTANYKNSSSIDVTPSAVITPAEGTVLTTDIVTGPDTSLGEYYYNLPVNISYTDTAGDKKTSSITLKIPHIEIKAPNKSTYNVGDTLDLSGFQEKIDGVDVTSFIRLEHPRGTIINDGMVIPSSWYTSRYAGTPTRAYIFCYHTDSSINNKEAFFFISVYE